MIKKTPKQQDANLNLYCLILPDSPLSCTFLANKGEEKDLNQSPNNSRKEPHQLSRISQRSGSMEGVLEESCGRPHKCIEGSEEDKERAEPKENMNSDDDDVSLKLSYSGEMASLFHVLHPPYVQPETLFPPPQELSVNQTPPADTRPAFPDIYSSAFSASLPIPASKCCHCRKSRCLQLYCECFAADNCCRNCKCMNCLNNTKHEDERKAAKQSIAAKNPTGFSRSAIENDKEVKGGKGTQIFGGCNCSKSKCHNLYCYCFKRKVKCTGACRCANCLNGPALYSGVFKKCKRNFKKSVQNGEELESRWKIAKCEKEEAYRGSRPSDSEKKMK